MCGIGCSPARRDDLFDRQIHAAEFGTQGDSAGGNPAGDEGSPHLLALLVREFVLHRHSIAALFAHPRQLGPGHLVANTYFVQGGESAEAYIASQTHEGWQCLPEEYDDGGFTGGNMDRPALKRLMADIEAGLVDAVVVYKVDRLSRSLLNFAKIMEVFKRHNVSFVSVTQQFNTSTSMGRLVLNVLLSFAQFEREMISERTRDKIAATRRKG